MTSTSKCFLKFLSYNIEDVSGRLRNERLLLSEIMKYDLSAWLKHSYLMGATLAFQAFFHSQKEEQSIKKLNGSLEV